MLVFLTAFSTLAYAQVEVKIDNMSYLSGPTIADCGTIDLEDENQVTVQFVVDLEKPTAMVVGIGNLKVFTKKTSQSTEVEQYNQIVQDISWGTSSATEESFSASISITLYADNFNTSGGILFARYISSSQVPYDSSCDYSIEKDEVPGFSISPTSESVVCGNTSSKAFSVIPENIPAGSNVVYQWNIGNGWLENKLL